MNPDESKCNCQRCGQAIAFPTIMAGQDIACPHCERETTLTIPSLQSRVRKAEPDLRPMPPPTLPPVANSTIICSYVLSVLMPFAGFFAGIWLMTKQRSGAGLACIAISILFFLIWLAAFNQ